MLVFEQGSDNKYLWLAGFCLINFFAALLRTRQRRFKLSFLFYLLQYAVACAVEGARQSGVGWLSGWLADSSVIRLHRQRLKQNSYAGIK